MKDSPIKLKIYQGIIQYIVGSTHYTLKNIADLTNSSITSIRSIYVEGLLPTNFSSETQLLKLYQMILEINNHGRRFEKYLPIPKNFRQINHH